MANIANTDTSKATRDARGQAEARVAQLRAQLVDLEVAHEKLVDTILDTRSAIYAEEMLLHMLPATQGPNGSLARELEAVQGTEG